MPDHAPAEQAAKRPRRTPAYVALEAELETARAARAEAEADRRAAQQSVAQLFARAERAERLLALAVDAMTSPDPGALVALVRAAVGLPPSPVGDHADHPDDDEPPIEP